MSSESEILRTGPENPDHFREANKKQQSAFKETQTEKEVAMYAAADLVVDLYNARVDQGEPMSKKELAQLAEIMLDRVTEYGKGYSYPEINQYLRYIKSELGTSPGTGEGIRVKEKGALKKIRNHPDLADAAAGLGLSEQEQRQGKPTAFAAPKFNTFDSLHEFLNKHNF